MPTTEVMNVGIYVCVILAALSSGSLSLPSQSMRAESTTRLTNSLHAPSPNHTRQARSAPALSSNPFERYSQIRDKHEIPVIMSMFLDLFVPRKDSPVQMKSSLSSRAVGPSQRIKDRDYLGWMDFGRRSAEEYE